jgi:hypothetical protein
MSDRNFRELIPAYTLGALEPDEAAALEERLANDASLQEEVAAFRMIVAELPFAAPEARPPDSVKERLFARIAAPPEPLPFPVATARARRRWPAVAAALAAALLIAVLAGNLFAMNRQLQAVSEANAALTRQLAEAEVNNSELRRARDDLNSRLDDARRNQQRLVADLSQARAQVSQLKSKIESDERVVSFLSGPDLASRDLTATGEARGAQGTMYMRPGDRTAVVLVSGLPALAPGETYQFWLANGPIQYNAGVMTLADEGNAYLLVRAPVEVNRFGEVMVTVEQSAEPTASPAETTVLQGVL